MPNVDRESLEARKPHRFSYAIIDGGPGHFDLFKVYTEGGSLHLASFDTHDEAVAFAKSLPPARLMEL